MTRADISLKDRIAEGLKETGRQFGKLRRDPVVPSAPHLDADGAAYFGARLQDSRRYLEYGSGASTVLACRGGREVVSVESDRQYLNAVARRLPPDPAGVMLLHAYIGLTGEWGAPVVTRPTPERLRRWAAYATLPWDQHYDPNGSCPDLILIDGRFRLACMMVCLLRLRGRACEILLNDYTDRQDYHVVAGLLPPRALHGRLAVFDAPAELPMDSVTRLLERFVADPD